MNIITKIINKFKQESEESPYELLGMEGLAARNEARLAKIKDEMGDKWILHPSHTKHKLDEPRPV